MCLFVAIGNDTYIKKKKENDTRLKKDSNTQKKRYKSLIPPHTLKKEKEKRKKGLLIELRYLPLILLVFLERNFIFTHAKFHLPTHHQIRPE